MFTPQPFPRSLCANFPCIFQESIMARFFNHWIVFFSFKQFLNAIRCFSSENPFSPAQNFNSHSSLSLRYLSKLCTFTFTHSSQLISCLPPSFFRLYNLPTFPFRCRLQYLIISTAHAFVLAITFPPWNCDLSNFFTLLMYSFFSISLFMMESNCNTSKYLYLSRLASIMHFPCGNSIPTVPTIFLLFKTSTTHLFWPNTIPTSTEKILTVWISQSYSLSIFAYIGRQKKWDESISDFDLLHIQGLSCWRVSIKV